MRRITAAVSLVLLGAAAIGAAEASLLALLVLFSVILKLRLGIELGAAWMQFGQNFWPATQVNVFNGATVLSFVFTAGCGVAAAAWRYRRWRPTS